MTLLFDAFSAYLGPLLAKDREGKYIQWEDLVASHSASSEVLKAEENNSASRKRLEDLHQSQVQAYKEAAQKALREWAISLPLEPMEDEDTEKSFVHRCVAAALKRQWPNWKVEKKSVRLLVALAIRKRARAIFAKYKTEVEEPEAEAEADAGEVESGEEGEDDEGEAGEEGETETEDQKTSEPKSKLGTAKTAPTKKRVVVKANSAVAKAKAAQLRKKATTTKQATPAARAQAARKGPPGNRAKRGGRGGATKSN